MFSLVPVESIVRDHQANYYSALNACNRSGDATVFIEFMLKVIQEALPGTEQATEQVTEQVRKLLGALENGEMLTREMMKALGLRHRPTFLYSYLKPAKATLK